MAEATLDPNEADALREAAQAIDVARMKQLGATHLAMATGALTLWGAAVTWAQVTGWGLAHAAALANAVLAGAVIASTIHEWGHLAGARLLGAASPMFEAPKRHFFVFDFPLDQNDPRQFLAMSWGGILAPWLAVAAAALLVPLALPSGAVLLAALVWKATTATVFEVPVVRRVMNGEAPGAALGAEATGGGLARGQKLGAAAGLACLAALWWVA